MERDKRIIVAALFILVSLALLSNFNLIEIIGGSLIDTYAVTSDAAVNITVTDDFPSINISSPRNLTYNHGLNLLFNFTINDSNLDSRFYSLNGGANTTLTANFTFNASEGSNTLRVYANDSFNQLSSVTVIFFVSETLGEDVELPTEYEDPIADTTNFSALNKSEQQNLENMILHSPNFGKITFGEVINLSDNTYGYGDEARLLINLSAYTIISNNRILISSEDLIQLNKSATIELYNLTFSDPIILKDDVECPDTICTIISYSGGTAIFNVTHFTEYSLEEGAIAGQARQGGKSNWPTATIVKTSQPEGVAPGGEAIGGETPAVKPKEQIPTKAAEIQKPKGLRISLESFWSELVILPFILTVILFLIFVRLWFKKRRVKK
ncbi:MAG: hypothetical protein Q8R00_03915 [Candidatus Nanoarchaeia archaeon]|nr:hypothetical protein [Candidatus Nanoarchaeia archaeon]